MTSKNALLAGLTKESRAKNHSQKKIILELLTLIKSLILKLIKNAAALRLRQDRNCD